jgi:hypothetical protein
MGITTGMVFSISNSIGSKVRPLRSVRDDDGETGAMPTIRRSASD